MGRPWSERYWYTAKRLGKACNEAWSWRNIFNSIDHDGARKGYDEFTVKELCQTVSIPVIAFGGIFRWPQLMKGFEAGAEGLAVANQLHYTEHAARKAKLFLQEAGVPTRIAS